MNGVGSMKRFAVALALGGLALLSSPVVTPAQTPLSPAQIRQLGLDIQPGQWFDYVMDSPESGRQPLRMAWLETESRSGQTYQWIEIESSVEGERMIAKMLVNLDATAVDSSLASLIFKLGDEPALEMSGMMLGMGLEQLGVGDVDEWESEPIILGQETIQVPAGTYQTTVIAADADDWRGFVAPEVGLVKAEWPEGSLELVAAGQDARSAITETPISFESLFMGQ